MSEQAIASARGATLGYAVACAATVGTGLGARFYAPFVLAGWGLVGVCVIVGVFALIRGGAPIKQRTGFDVDFMVSNVWLMGGFGLLVPPIALVRGALLLARGSVGGYRATNEEGTVSRYYPKVMLTNGEGKPLGWTFIVMGTLWPLAMVAVFYR